MICCHRLVACRHHLCHIFAFCSNEGSLCTEYRPEYFQMLYIDDIWDLCGEKGEVPEMYHHSNIQKHSN